MPKRNYDKEFKLNAVSLVIDQGLSINKVSQDLGIGLSTLQRWVRELKTKGNNNVFPGSGHSNADEERVRTLERENEVLRRERDILKNHQKKAASFPVNRNPGKGLDIICLSKRAAVRLLVVYPVKKHGPGVMRTRHWWHISDPV